MLRLRLTTRAGTRPYGVGYLFAGYDRHFGFQVYVSDPSGNYGGWKATAMGKNKQTATDMFKTEYTATTTVSEALTLSVAVLAKLMDITPTADRMEFFVMRMGDDGKVAQHVLSAAEVATLFTRAEAAAATKGDS